MGSNSNYNPPGGVPPTVEDRRVYLSTGIVEGLALLPDVGGTTFDIAEGKYQILNMTDIDGIVPIEFDVAAGDYVNVAVPNILTEDFTYVFLTNAGMIFLKNTPPELDDVDIYAYLGNLTHTAGTLGDPTNLGWMAYNSTLDENRRNFEEGTKRINGLEFDFIGNGLAPDLSEGAVFRLGANRLVNDQQPSTITIGASTYGNNGGGLFSHLNVISDGGGGVTIAGEATIDFVNYDGGAGGFLPVGNNRYANHFFWLFPTTAGGYFLFHEYGKVSYATLNDCIVGLETESHFDFLSEAALIGVISGRNNVVAIDTAITGGDAFYTPSATIATLF